MNFRIHNFFQVLITCVVFFGAADVAFSDRMSEGEEKMNELFTPQLHRKLQFGNEAAISECLELLESQGGSRDEAVRLLVDFVLEDDLVRGHFRTIRLLGKELEPSFSDTLFVEIGGDHNARKVGGLLELLRGVPWTRSENGLGMPLLDDRRDTEDLSRHMLAEGAAPFRVCDLVYNLIQEARSNQMRLSRSLNESERDRAIDRLKFSLKSRSARLGAVKTREEGRSGDKTAVEDGGAFSAVKRVPSFIWPAFLILFVGLLANFIRKKLLG